MRNLLRSLWTEPRPAQPLRRVWRDWVLIGLVVGSAGLEVALRDGVTWGPVPIGVPLLLGLTLMWRRTRPLAVVVVAFGAMTALSATVLVGSGAPVLYAWSWVLVLPYALFRWGSGRDAMLGLPIMLASAVFGLVLDFTGLLDAVVGLAILLLPAALGASVRYRTNVRLREIDQAKLVEREQLARELHDTVAHHVSAIAIQAQAGRAVATSHPDRALESLRVIEEAASRTLAEMRTMVGVLRESGEAGESRGPDLAPQPGLSDIAGLAGDEGGRPRIDVELSGRLDDLSPAVGAAIYRLAQESITNVRQHARHATRVTVRVVGDHEGVHLTVDDDGDPGPPGRRPAGYGLIGMRERVTLLGGTFAAGPASGRGWRVDAVLPRAGDAP